MRAKKESKASNKSKPAVSKISSIPMGAKSKPKKDKKAGAAARAVSKREELTKIKRQPKKDSSDEEESSENEESDDEVVVIDSSSDDSCDSDDENKKQNDSDDDDVDDESTSQSDDDDKGTKGKKASTPLFSDENAKWLKPKVKKGKQQLLEDDDDDDEKQNDSAIGHEDDDDDDDLLDIEREARLVDAEIEAERQEAEEEMRRTVAEHTSIYHLPTKSELDRDIDRVVPPSEIRQHVESILEVLAEFKARREKGRSRKEYVDQLGAFLAELYGYLPELVDYFLTMFSPAECLEFIDASDKPRPMVIRANTLKTRRKDLAAALMKRGVSLDPLANWSKVGLKIIESPVPMGATPEYLGGLYMLQSAASMCPVMALAPETKEYVLDMSAAPGGKTSYMAQLMRNTGVIIANDLKAERQKATVANMHRLGVKNVITCTHDGRKLGTIFKNRFDRILLDAPCSGLGVISRDPSVKVQRTIADVNQCAHLQKQLILAAIDALKVKGSSPGVLVYSTCSVSVAENEEVVNYALSKRDIRIIPTGLDFGKPGFKRYQQKRFHPSLELTRRFYPHVHNMDGFFVAKIEKLSDKQPGADSETGEEAVEEPKTVETDGDLPARKEGDKVQGDKTKKTKKRKARDERDKETDATKKDKKVSVPPPKQKSKKPKLNAKVTKPRRKKTDSNLMEG